MARPKRCRCVHRRPNTFYFKPRDIPTSLLKEVNLAVEELEAIRLKDVEGLDQERASKKMKISRPTFHRVLDSARKKIADALVNAKAVKIEGGDFEMAEREFKCSSCKHSWKEAFGTGKRGVDMKCPKCGSDNIHRTDVGGFGEGRMPWGRRGRYCRDSGEKYSEEKEKS